MTKPNPENCKNCSSKNCAQLQYTRESFRKHSFLQILYTKFLAHIVIDSMDCSGSYYISETASFVPEITADNNSFTTRVCCVSVASKMITMCVYAARSSAEFGTRWSEHDTHTLVSGKTCGLSFHSTIAAL